MPSAALPTPGTPCSWAQEFAPNSRLPLHRHEAGYLTLVLAGEYREASNGGCRELRALDVVRHPPGVAHANDFGPRGARCFNLCVTAEALDPEWCRCANAEFDPLTIEFLALATGFLLSQVPPVIQTLPSLDRRRAIPPQVAEMHRALARAGGHRQVQQIARAHGRHPVAAARLFRRLTGASPAEVARRARDIRAAVAVLRSDAPLSAVAALGGYSDQAHLTRAFRALVGLSPWRARRRFRNAAELPVSSIQDPLRAMP